MLGKISETSLESVTSSEVYKLLVTSLVKLLGPNCDIMDDELTEISSVVIIYSEMGNEIISEMSNT